MENAFLASVHDVVNAIVTTVLNLSHSPLMFWRIAKIMQFLKTVTGKKKKKKSE